MYTVYACVCVRVCVCDVHKEMCKHVVRMADVRITKQALSHTPVGRRKSVGEAGTGHGPNLCGNDDDTFKTIYAIYCLYGANLLTEL